MKLTKCLKLFLLMISLQYAFSRNLNSNHATCSISSISIPIGSSSPVMVYNARMDNSNWKFTVLEKDLSTKYRVDGNLFYSDNNSGESWYADRDVNEKSFEAMRDAFSLCKNLNFENKSERKYETEKSYENLRTSSLPENVSLRVNKSKSEESVTTSFLQMKVKLQTRDSILDSEMEKALDDLDRDDAPDLIAEQYKNLNNDAYDQNKELQHQIDLDNGNVSHNTHDLILD